MDLDIIYSTFSRSGYENPAALSGDSQGKARTTVLLVEKARQDLAARPFGDRSLLLKLANMGTTEARENKRCERVPGKFSSHHTPIPRHYDGLVISCSISQAWNIVTTKAERVAWLRHKRIKSLILLVCARHDTPYMKGLHTWFSHSSPLSIVTAWSNPAISSVQKPN